MRPFAPAQKPPAGPRRRERAGQAERGAEAPKREVDPGIKEVRAADPLQGERHVDDAPADAGDVLHVFQPARLEACPAEKGVGLDDAIRERARRDEENALRQDAGQRPEEGRRFVAMEPGGEEERHTGGRQESEQGNLARRRASEHRASSGAPCETRPCATARRHRPRQGEERQRGEEVAEGIDDKKVCVLNRQHCCGVESRGEQREPAIAVERSREREDGEHDTEIRGRTQDSPKDGLVLGMAHVERFDRRGEQRRRQRAVSEIRSAAVARVQRRSRRVEIFADALWPAQIVRGHEHVPFVGMA